MSCPFKAPEQCIIQRSFADYERITGLVVHHTHQTIHGVVEAAFSVRSEAIRINADVGFVGDRASGQLNITGVAS